MVFSNPDWVMAEKRLIAFWHKSIVDRPCLQVYVDLGTMELEYEQQTMQTSTPHRITPESFWTDPQIFMQVNRRRYRQTAYLGEALPVLYPNAEHVAIAMGSEVKYDYNTIWIHKTPGSLAELDFSSVTPRHDVICKMVDYFKSLAVAAEQECFVGFPHMGNTADTMARIRGYGEYCLDLQDDPDLCFQMEEQVLRIWKMCFDLLYKTINQKMSGSCSWLPAWHPGRCALIEFDFCALISPAHFRRYIPFLSERAAYADHAIFHLDGPDALKHLDALLDIDEIGFIQWEPGSYDRNIMNWIPLMQKIQAAGKGLYVSGRTPDVAQARILLKELKPEGLMLPVRAGSISEAEQFLDSVKI